MMRNIFLAFVFVPAAFLPYAHAAIANEAFTGKEPGVTARESRAVEVDTVPSGMYSLRYRNADRNTGSQAVSVFDMSKVKNVGGTNRMNALAGHIPGLIINQRQGMPGNEWSRLLVRGINSFGISNANPLILLDGIETEINHINPYTIESITVLKDAAATAMFGFRGGAGVILLESRRGREGPVSVEVMSQTSIVQPMRTPSFLGAYDYAILHNEARRNDGLQPIYGDDALAGFKSGDDPFRYPDVNWIDEFMREESYQTRNNLVITAGDADRSYFFSLGHTHNTGLFNVDESVNTYSTNTNFNAIDFQTSVVYKASDRLAARADIKARLDSRRTPGEYWGFEDRMFHHLYNTPPLAMPVFNPDGSLAGTSDFRNNLYGELNHAGYSIWKRAVSSGMLDLDYDMNDFVEGLRIRSKLSYVNFADHITNRSKQYAVYQYIDAGNVNQFGQDTNMSNFSQWGQNNRYLSGEIGLDYFRRFGHNTVSAGFFADRQERYIRDTKLSRVYQALRGFAGYALNDKYMVDFVFSYMGSEQFPPDERYGFFPAVSLGWLVSEETFMSGNSLFDLLKVRLSYGLAGNDFDPYSSNTPYFGYLENFSPGMGYRFGRNTAWEQGFFEQNAANPAITWEKISKFNAGIDGHLLDNRLIFGVDYFHEESRDILILGANSAVMGYDFWVPAGIANNSGFDAFAGWKDQLGRLKYNINASLLHASNKINEQIEAPAEYAWMMRTGHPIGSLFGYTFDRYFTEDDDPADFPDHSYLGELKPGDLIYVDLNGDGLIDERDISFIANPDVPKIYAGLQLGLAFEGFDFNLALQGTLGAAAMYWNPFYHEFLNGVGNVREVHLDRWTEGSGQDAGNPRLTTTGSTVSRVNSTYWVRELNYLRIRSAEIGYTFSGQMLEKYQVRQFRVFFSGFNLFTWDDTGEFDPEFRNWGNGYPLTRYFTAGFNLVF